ncbi:hypothetical protein DSECCO2_500100 [anaerobic digester metagenome]
MPVTPSSILPRRAVPEIATGPVVAVGVGSVSVRIKPDLAVAMATDRTFAVGQMVTVAASGGQWSSAQIIGSAQGSAPRIRHVVV